MKDSDNHTRREVTDEERIADLLEQQKAVVLKLTMSQKISLN
jgi:hypothetical protein